MAALLRVYSGLCLNFSRLQSLAWLRFCGEPLPQSTAHPGSELHSRPPSRLPARKNGARVNEMILRPPVYLRVQCFQLCLVPVFASILVIFRLIPANSSIVSFIGTHGIVGWVKSSNCLSTEGLSFLGRGMVNIVLASLAYLVWAAGSLCIVREEHVAAQFAEQFPVIALLAALAASLPIFPGTRDRMESDMVLQTIFVLLLFASCGRNPYIPSLNHGIVQLDFARKEGNAQDSLDAARIPSFLEGLALILYRNDPQMLSISGTISPSHPAVAAASGRLFVEVSLISLAYLYISKVWHDSDVALALERARLSRRKESRRSRPAFFLRASSGADTAISVGVRPGPVSGGENGAKDFSRAARADSASVSAQPANVLRLKRSLLSSTPRGAHGFLDFVSPELAAKIADGFPEIYRALSVAWYVVLTLLLLGALKWTLWPTKVVLTHRDTRRVSVAAVGFFNSSHYEQSDARVLGAKDLAFIYLRAVAQNPLCVQGRMCLFWLASVSIPAMYSRLLARFLIHVGFPWGYVNRVVLGGRGGRSEAAGCAEQAQPTPLSNRLVLALLRKGFHFWMFAVYHVGMFDYGFYSFAASFAMVAFCALEAGRGVISTAFHAKTQKYVRRSPHNVELSHISLLLSTVAFPAYGAMIQRRAVQPSGQRQGEPLAGAQYAKMCHVVGDLPETPLEISQEGVLGNQSELPSFLSQLVPQCLAREADAEVSISPSAYEGRHATWPEAVAHASRAGASIDGKRRLALGGPALELGIRILSSCGALSVLGGDTFACVVPIIHGYLMNEQAFRLRDFGAVTFAYPILLSPWDSGSAGDPVSRAIQAVLAGQHSQVAQAVSARQAASAASASSTGVGAKAAQTAQGGQAGQPDRGGARNPAQAASAALAAPSARPGAAPGQASVEVQTENQGDCRTEVYTTVSRLDASCEMREASGNRTLVGTLSCLVAVTTVSVIGAKIPLSISVICGLWVAIYEAVGVFDNLELPYVFSATCLALLMLHAKIAAVIRSGDR